MKLAELAHLYDFKLEDVESLIFEQEGHVGRVRLIPPPTQPLHYHPDQQFNEDKYPYIIIELKNGEIIDAKIGYYSWVTSCPKATGGVPS
jgi:adenylosuccinate synthase